MNIVVGQSGGPSVAINATLAGIAIGGIKHPKVDKVYGMLHGIDGLLKENLVLLNSYADRFEVMARTPAMALGSCRFKLPPVEQEEIYEKIYAVLKKYDIGAFYYIGGNDSMDTIKKLTDYGNKIDSPIRFIGVPKTIDNDLAITDHTPGFGSAAKYIAATTKEIIRDGLVYDYPVVSVIEIMGRNAGWLTAAAALSKGEDCEGVDLIYMPETVFDLDKFIAKVGELLKEERSIVIAVSEGIKVADGRYVCELADHIDYVDAFGHKQLAGTARFLTGEISKRFKVKTRAIELSSLQRCAAHVTSRIDITEAFNAGGAAVKLAFEGGATGQVITLQRVSEDPYMCITQPADVHFIANVEKKVPREWINEDGTYVTPELVHYIRPLIQAEIAPLWVDGLPRHLKLER